MTEKTLYLENFEPIHLFGVNNSKLRLIQKLFPKLKILTRGHELKVMGEEQDIYEFEEKVNLLIEYYNRFNSLTEVEIEQILTENGQSFFDTSNEKDGVLLYSKNGKPIKARTVNQNQLVKATASHDLIFAIGPAGTGKTYTAITLAVRAFRNKEIKKIILTRPAVESGERLGYLPGDLKEKLDPYLQPLYDALHDMIPSKKLMEYVEENIIEVAPLAFMRGRTLDNAFVILDEAQNTTVNQLKMFLTRMGKNAKFIITGDITQIDLPSKTKSGLVQAIKILKKINNVSVVEFDTRDIVRHQLVKDIVKAYSDNDIG
jgi:phosphate starvation-inducible PhoH-like protein